MEAVSVVIPRTVLDQKYPGGTDGYLAAAGGPHSMARHALTDDNLTSVSFPEQDSAAAWASGLAAHGIVGVTDGVAREIACVDQQLGPRAPCNWLEWRRADEGYTFGWAAGTEPGALATPADWSPDRWRQIRSSDTPEEIDRYLRLSEENGLETWLDFETGQQQVALTHLDHEPTVEGGVVREAPPEGSATSSRPPIASVRGAQRSPGSVGSDRLGHLQVASTAAGDDSATPDGGGAVQRAETRGPIAKAVCKALTDIEFVYEMPSPDFIRFPIVSDLGTSFPVLVTINEQSETVCYYGVLPLLVPASERVKVAELLTRINFCARLGNFEMDWADGQVRYRYGIDVEYGALTPGMARLAIARIPKFCDLCLDAVLRVIYANSSAEDAHHVFDEKMRRGSGGAPAS
jgi:hypothetical protein